MLDHIPSDMLERLKTHLAGDKSWVEYQHSIRCGDCQHVATAAAEYLIRSGVNAHVVVGLVRYPFPVLSSNLVDDDASREVRHWLVVVGGAIYEFASGTLCNGVIDGVGNAITCIDLELINPSPFISYIQ